MVVVVEGESDEEQSGLIKGQELEWNKSNYVRTSEGCLDRGTDRQWIRRDETRREGKVKVKVQAKQGRTESSISPLERSHHEQSLLLLLLLLPPSLLLLRPSSSLSPPKAP